MKSFMWIAGVCFLSSAQAQVPQVMVQTLRFDSVLFDGRASIYYARDVMVHEQLVRDLGARTQKKTDALFYTDFQVRKERLKPEFTIQLCWKQVRFEKPIEYTQPVKTAAHNNYQSVTAASSLSGEGGSRTMTHDPTLLEYRYEYGASGSLELRVLHTETRRLVFTDSFPASFIFSTPYMKQFDINRTNPTGAVVPSQEQAMASLLTKVYTELQQTILGFFRKSSAQ